MICAYALAAVGGEADQIGASFIFAVVNLLGSFVFLIGIAGLYHVTGTLDMATAASRMGAVEPNSAILIAVSFFIAFGIKLGLFPFHFWLPAVYCTAIPPVAAMLSGRGGQHRLLRPAAARARACCPRRWSSAPVVLLVLGSASILYGGLPGDRAGARRPRCSPTRRSGRSATC